MTETFERLQERLLPDADRITELILTAHQREIPDLPDDEAFALALREAVRADLVDAFVGVRLGRPVPEALTAQTSHLARTAARSRVSLQTLLSILRVGYLVVWREICAALDDLEPDPAKREPVLRATTDLMFEANSRLAKLQTDEYLAERDRFMRTREQKRLVAVQQVLDDAADDLAGLEYELDGEHWAVVASGADAERTLAEAGAARRLLVQAGPDLVWGWFRDTAPDLDAIPPGRAVVLGLGRPGRGRAGFITSHKQAQAAQAIGQARGEAVTRFQAVALESLTTRDRAAARRFTQDELGPLLGSPDRSARLIDTLEAYLEAGHNASAMAARLNISVRTGSYRIRTIEETLGCTIASRNAELHTAVRLHRLLDAG